MNAKIKPWCNYSFIRTTSARKWAGGRRNKPHHAVSKKRGDGRNVQWWKQAEHNA